MWPWLAAGMCHSPCRCRGRLAAAGSTVLRSLCPALLEDPALAEGRRPGSSLKGRERSEIKSPMRRSLVPSGRARRSSAEAERGPGRSRRSRGPEATKPRRSFGDESPVNSTRTSWLAKGRSGRARGTSSPASQKSRVAEDFFNRFPAEGVEAAEGSSASGGEPQGLLQSLKGLDDLEADLLGASRPGSGPGKTTVKGATGYRTDVSFLGMEPQLFPWTSSSLFCTRPDENRCSGSGFGWLRASLVHPKAQLHLWVGSSCTVTTLQALVSLVAAAGMPMGLVVPSNLLSP
ncbi:uncharacterized protein LOC141932955 [Strix aluco]|uniref:uncharacterized protein LOC141932955 n=1 Tax=Strix aluco TaxID=111821 RepID=UPI003DA235B8